MEFIKPTLMTDNWDNDIRLNQYKDKYEKFKFGMGIPGKAGPKNAFVPTWNILVYDLDINGDGKQEAVLYGENVKLGTYPPKSGVRTHRGALSASSYRIFDSDDFPAKGIHLVEDPIRLYTKNINNILISDLIRLKNTISVIIVIDLPDLYSWPIFQLAITQIGRQTHEKGHSFGAYNCVYDLIKR